MTYSGSRDYPESVGYCRACGKYSGDHTSDCPTAKKFTGKHHPEIVEFNKETYKEDHPDKPERSKDVKEWVRALAEATKHGQNFKPAEAVLKYLEDLEGRCSLSTSEPPAGRPDGVVMFVENYSYCAGKQHKEIVAYIKSLEANQRQPVEEVSGRPDCIQERLGGYSEPWRQEILAYLESLEAKEVQNRKTIDTLAHNEKYWQNECNEARKEVFDKRKDEPVDMSLLFGWTDLKRCGDTSNTVYVNSNGKHLHYLHAEHWSKRVKIDGNVYDPAQGWKEITNET